MLIAKHLHQHAHQQHRDLHHQHQLLRPRIRLHVRAHRRRDPLEGPQQHHRAQTRAEKIDVIAQLPEFLAQVHPQIPGFMRLRRIRLLEPATPTAEAPLFTAKTQHLPREPQQHQGSEEIRPVDRHRCAASKALPRPLSKASSAHRVFAHTIANPLNRASRIPPLRSVFLTYPCIRSSTAATKASISPGAPSTSTSTRPSNKFRTCPATSNSRATCIVA